MVRGLRPGGGASVIVSISQADSDKLRDALVFIKGMSKNKNDKKFSAEILTKLDRLNWGEDSVVGTYPKQLFLKPAEMRMLDSLKDIYSLELDSPHIGYRLGAVPYSSVEPGSLPARGSKKKHKKVK